MPHVTLHVGQAVTWPKSPSGLAQVAELRRRKVRIVYVTKRGTIRQPVVKPADILRQPLLFPLDNPLDRGVLKRERTYEIPPPRK